jgi:hypothetical protein
MHKNATKCNKTQSKWCINKHGSSKLDLLALDQFLWQWVVHHGKHERDDRRGGKCFRSFIIRFSLSSDQREKSEWSLDRDRYVWDVSVGSLETIILRSFLGLIISLTLLDICDIIDGVILCYDLTERWPLHMGSTLISQIFCPLVGLPLPLCMPW